MNVASSDLVIKNLFQNAQKIAVASHIRPDGDAVGSLLGLGNALIAAGKDVQLVLQDGVPSDQTNLPGAELVKRKVDGDVDLFIAVDCSDLARLGTVLGDRMVDLNIDHHITNINFAKVNFVLPEAAATCEVIASHLACWGLPLNKNSATCLLAGIITDTIGFRTSSTTSTTLRLAADLVDQGIDLYQVYYDNLVKKPLRSIRLWQKGLSGLQKVDRLIYTVLSLADKKSIGYDGNDDADLINIMNSIEDVDIAIVFVQLSKNIVKVSWRSRPGFDISRVAIKFGGGGHPAASGAEIAGELDEVVSRVVAASAQVLSSVENI